ncbi:MAG: porin [Thermoguttaceae bacterium]
MRYMLQCFRQSMAPALALAAVCGLSAIAGGQQFQQPVPQGQGYVAGNTPIANGPPFQAQAPVPPTQAASFENGSATAPVPQPPPPPSAETANADLTQRVADLEKRLADLAKQGTTTTSGAPTRPLIVPTGRIQFDTAEFTQNAASNAEFGNVENAVGFRRARIALLGGYQTVDYIIEMDFANRGIDSTIDSKSQGTAFKDVYVQMHDLPLLGNIRAGHFKECFGLEQVTSDNYTTFMERSICDEGAFVPGRNDGIMTFNWSQDQRATWAAGVFTNQTGYDQPPLFQFDHWGLDATTRLTYLPWYDEPSGGRGVFHTGIDYAYRSAPDDIGIFATKTEAAFGPSVVNMTVNATTPAKTTALLDVNHWQVTGTEAALVYGPLSVQSEFFTATVDQANNVTNHFYGGYAYVSYFLTGENRPYNRKMGVFDRVIPYEDFFRVRTSDGCVSTGKGAWEVAYRFSYIDMLDGLTTQGAGRAADQTVGLNWYLNPFTRVMFNYVHSLDTYNIAAGKRVSGGIINEFMTRLAMDF